jgi:acyl-coenzyme A synthetase/AMP-(fatty) acid ligase
VRPAPGITVRARDGELQIARAASPYLGQAAPDRWSDGWLRTRDAGLVDEATGLVTILGRLDSQVTIGGLQVDLAEVEASIGALPGVVAAVVLFDEAITAYLQLEPGHRVEDVEASLAIQLARFKQPQVYQVFDQFPRTTTGKLVRDRAVLRASAT